MLRARWPVSYLFLNHADLCGCFFLYSFWHFVHSLSKLGAELMIKMFFGDGCPQFVRYSVSAHWLLNHISEVRAGPCAAYTAETKQSGERSGITALFILTGAILHAVLLFRGRMIDRRMRDIARRIGSHFTSLCYSIISASLKKDL